MNSEPLIVTFADARYLPLLDVWVARLKHLGATRIKIYGLDTRTLEWCRDQGLAASQVDWNGDVRELWVKRIQEFSALLAAGEEIVHSDVDAIWIRDPFSSGSAPSCAEDLVFSQGTVWPFDVHRRWGFVLCCGWFRVRPTTAAREFFRQLELHVRMSGDDQMSVNRLLASSGAQWNRAPAADYQLPYRGGLVSCWHEPIRAQVPSSSLSVALLPHAEFQRLPDTDIRAVVKHYLTPKDCQQKLIALRSLGVIP